MFGARSRETPQRIGFFLVPRFSMIALTSAVETLRLANRSSGLDLYRWPLVSDDGGPVVASNGIPLAADWAVGECESLSMVVVCGGVDIQRYENRKTYSWLRRLTRGGSDVGALCTGSHLLARSGLLDGYRCTIHWEHLAGFREEFPDIEVTCELFEIDRDRFTCSGGTAAADLMLNLVARQHGHELAAEVADQLIHDRIRGPHDHQRVALRTRLGASHPKLLAVAARMEEHLEEPLSCGELAASVGLSTRHLERLFRKYVGRTPTRYYLELRLDRARLLLVQTSLSALDVALACGFVSASHFTKCYRDRFGRTPREERRQPS